MKSVEEYPQHLLEELKHTLEYYLKQHLELEETPEFILILKDRGGNIRCRGLANTDDLTITTLLEQMTFLLKHNN